MFNLLHPERFVAVSRSSSQQICEEAITGKNKKSKEREHDIRCQEVQKPPRHFIMGRQTRDTHHRSSLVIYNWTEPKKLSSFSLEGHKSHAKLIDASHASHVRTFVTSSHDRVSL